MKTLRVRVDEFYRHCDLVRVVDGDTVIVHIDLGWGVWLRDQTLRLAGIDAPEIRTRDKKEKARGIAAKEYLEQILGPPGSELAIRSDKRGKYGRWIATLFTEWHVASYTETLCVNDLLVEKAHAVRKEY